MKKTKFGDYETVVKFPVFMGYTVHVVMTEDICTSRKQRYGDYGDSEDARGLHTSSMGGVAHIFYLRGSLTPGILAHEAWHAIYCMFRWAGVDDFDNETVAYHIGYLVDRVDAFVSRVITSEEKAGKHGVSKKG